MDKNSIKSKHPSDQAVAVLVEAIKTEALRVKYSLGIGQKRLAVFEEKYGVSSVVFMDEWTAENLEGKDIEYVEWAGEIKLVFRLKERLAILKDIEYDS